MKKRKTSQHINNEEKVSQTQEKNQSSGTAPDVTKVMELADKDFKIAIIIVFSNKTSRRVRLK